MSSETSTEAVRLKPDAAPDGRVNRRPDSALQPWQFFVLAGLGCATAVTFLVRGQGVTVVVLMTVIMTTVTLVGMAALRALRPLFAPQDDRSQVIGLKTRVALEREKALALRTIKELEFDHAMGKISEEDFREMSVRLRARATRLIQQLDASEGYRTQIERDLAKRLGESDKAATVSVCGRCSTKNDPDARFCKACGERL